MALPAVEIKHKTYVSYLLNQLLTALLRPTIYKLILFQAVAPTGTLFDYALGRCNRLKIIV